MRISQTRVHSGDVVSGAVETTSNVASVEARIESRLGVFSTSLRRSRYGHFELAYRVPSVPFYAHGTYTLRLLARNVDGKIAEHDLPFTIQ